MQCGLQSRYIYSEPEKDLLHQYTQVFSGSFRDANLDRLAQGVIENFDQLPHFKKMFFRHRVIPVITDRFGRLQANCQLIDTLREERFKAEGYQLSIEKTLEHLSGSNPKERQKVELLQRGLTKAIALKESKEKALKEQEAVKDKLHGELRDLIYPYSSLQGVFEVTISIEQTNEAIEQAIKKICEVPKSLRDLIEQTILSWANLRMHFRQVCLNLSEAESKPVSKQSYCKSLVSSSLRYHKELLKFEQGINEEKNRCNQLVEEIQSCFHESRSLKANFGSEQIDSIDKIVKYAQVKISELESELDVYRRFHYSLLIFIMDQERLELGVAFSKEASQERSQEKPFLEILDGYEKRYGKQTTEEASNELDCNEIFAEAKTIKELKRLAAEKRQRVQRELQDNAEKHQKAFTANLVRRAESRSKLETSQMQAEPACWEEPWQRLEETLKRAEETLKKEPTRYADAMRRLQESRSIEMKKETSAINPNPIGQNNPENRRTLNFATTSIVKPAKRALHLRFWKVVKTAGSKINSFFLSPKITKIQREAFVRDYLKVQNSKPFFDFLR